MTELPIGKIITTNEKRDAIHIAVAPVVAAHDLLPGQHIGFDRHGKATADPEDLVGDHIGIVDPFLDEPVLTDEKFWIFLYPNTVMGLRHDWVHPSFPSREK